MAQSAGITVRGGGRRSSSSSSRVGATCYSRGEAQLQCSRDGRVRGGFVWRVLQDIECSEGEGQQQWCVVAHRCRCPGLPAMVVFWSAKPWAGNEGSVLRAKALTGILAGRDDDDALWHCLPGWGHHLGAITSFLMVLWVSDGGAFWCHFLLGGVVFRDPPMLVLFLVHWSWAMAKGVGCSAVWQAQQVLPTTHDGVCNFGGSW